MPRRPRTWPEHRNVRRYEHHQFTGWVVSLKRRGKRFVRYFGDHKDPAAALRRALAWRNEMTAALPPPVKLQWRHKLNTTGVIGVFRRVERARSGAILQSYGATWIHGGRRFKRTFSIAKYGERKARALAVEARRRAVAEILASRS